MLCLNQLMRKEHRPFNQKIRISPKSPRSRRQITNNRVKQWQVKEKSQINENHLRRRRDYTFAWTGTSKSRY